MKIVAIPVIVVACIPPAFIALTTSFPSLPLVRISFQHYTAANMPNQSPYKSKRSRIFHRILTAFPIGFLISLFWSLPQDIAPTFLPNSDEIRLRSVDFLMGRQCHRRLYKRLRDFSNTDSWISFDERWIGFCSAYMMSIESLGATHWVDLTHGGVLYDCTHAIIKNSRST